jgi:hypothetical protein
VRSLAFLNSDTQVALRVFFGSKCAMNSTPPLSLPLDNHFYWLLVFGIRARCLSRQRLAQIRPRVPEISVPTDELSREFAKGAREPSNRSYSTMPELSLGAREAYGCKFGGFLKPLPPMAIEAESCTWSQNGHMGLKLAESDAVE